MPAYPLQIKQYGESLANDLFNRAHRGFVGIDQVWTLTARCWQSVAVYLAAWRKWPCCQGHIGGGHHVVWKLRGK